MPGVEIPVRLRLIADKTGLDQISKAIGGGFMGGMRGGILGDGGGSGLIGGMGNLFGKAGVFGLMVKGINELNSTITSMFKYSPAMAQSMKALETSFFLIMKPIGDFIGGILRPLAMGLLDWISKNPELATILGGIALAIAAVETAIIGSRVFNVVGGGGGAGGAGGLGGVLPALSPLQFIAALSPIAFAAISKFIYEPMAEGARSGRQYLPSGFVEEDYKSGTRGSTIRYQTEKSLEEYAKEFLPILYKSGVTEFEDIKKTLELLGYTIEKIPLDEYGTALDDNIKSLENYSKTVKDADNIMQQSSIYYSKQASFLTRPDRNPAINTFLRDYGQSSLSSVTGGALEGGLEDITDSLGTGKWAVDEFGNIIEDTSTKTAYALNDLRDAAGRCILSFNSLAEAQSRGLFTNLKGGNTGYGSKSPQAWRQANPGDRNPYN